jgi:hypothetical protein
VAVGLGPPHHRRLGQAWASARVGSVQGGAIIWSELRRCTITKPATT